LEGLKRGLSVHVFDKKTVVGKPVKCGEYFPVRREMEELLPSAGEYMDVFDVPRNAIDNTCRKLRVISPSGSEFEFDFEAFVLDRTIGLQPQAQAKGRIFRVRSIEESSQSLRTTLTQL
jgi:hypothetical protein